MKLRTQQFLIDRGLYGLFVLAVVMVVHGGVPSEAYIEEWPASPVLIIIGAERCLLALRQKVAAHFLFKGARQMMDRESKAMSQGVVVSHWDMSAYPAPYLFLYCGSWEHDRVEAVIVDRGAKAEWLGRQFAIIRPRPRDCDPRVWAEALGDSFQGVVVQGGGLLALCQSLKMAVGLRRLGMERRS